MVTLEELRAEKQRLLRMKLAKDDLDQLGRMRKMEGKMLRREIKQLKSPKLQKSKLFIGRAAIGSGKFVGKFAAKGGLALFKVVEKATRPPVKRKKMSKKRRRK